MYDYIAIDFETATPEMNSACAVGIVAVKDLEICDYYYSLIQPPKNMYNDRNIAVHGITPDMTENAPTFSELWPEISHFFDVHTPVVAHNAGFDMAVFRSSLDLDIPDFIYIDTMNIGSCLFNKRLSLVNCADLMGLDLHNFDHHDAQEDAGVCALIMKRGLESFDCLTIWEFLAKNPQFVSRHFSDVKNHTSSHFRSIDRRSFDYTRPSDICCTKPVDENSPLYGKTVVFTGQLSIDRAQAMQLAVNAGACVKTAVSRKTNILVVGIQDRSIVGSDGMSNKEEYAYELNTSGKADISIITEQQFISLVGETECV